MAKKLTLISGKTRIEMTDEMEKMTNELVNKLLPNTRKKLENGLNQIEDDARSRWLVRDKKSKDSKSKMYSGVSITSDFQLVGHTGNTAPYAWAIKVGKDIQNTRLNQNDRLADKLIWKPVKDKTNDFVNTLADEIVLQLKKK